MAINPVLLVPVCTTNEPVDPPKMFVAVFDGGPRLPVYPTLPVNPVIPWLPVNPTLPVYPTLPVKPKLPV